MLLILKLAKTVPVVCYLLPGPIGRAVGEPPIGKLAYIAQADDITQISPLAGKILFELKRYRPPLHSPVTEQLTSTRGILLAVQTLMPLCQ